MRSSATRILIRMLIVGSVVACASSPLYAQGRGRSPGGAVVVVQLQDAGGGPFQEFAVVSLNTTDDPGGVEQETRDGIATFRNVSSRECTIQVTSTGYVTVRETVMVMGSRGENTAYIKMVHYVPGADQKTKAPLLTGKSRKELDQAVAALHADKPAVAKPKIEYALKHAPANPDVHYVAAVYFLSIKDVVSAEQQLSAAVTIYPDHFSAQLTLGNLLLAQRDAVGAVPHLEKALSLDENSWRAHWLLAEAYLIAPLNVAKARFHAHRALDLGKAEAFSAEITLAVADAFDGNYDAAASRLQQFLKDYPDSSSTPRAEAILAKVQASLPATTEDSRTFLPIHAMKGSTLLLDVPPGSTLRLPRGIDDATPGVAQGVVCPSEDVLNGAAIRAHEMVVALERFSAREDVVHDVLDQAGVTRKSYQRSFEYIAVLEHPRPEWIVVKELRDGNLSPKDFPVPVASQGTAGIGLLFLPEYAQDFSFSCEGLGQWHGAPAWQVRFEQRVDRPARMHGWIVKNRSYPTSIKGRAWISTASFRLLHIETDLANPIPEIQLDYEHVAIDYAPVKFPSGKGQLWLPVSSEVYARVRKRFFRQEHEFSAFELFSVKTLETDAAAKN